jgi:hypothetical protein
MSDDVPASHRERHGRSVERLRDIAAVRHAKLDGPRAALAPDPERPESEPPQDPPGRAHHDHDADSHAEGDACTLSGSGRQEDEGVVVAWLGTPGNP